MVVYLDSISSSNLRLRNTMVHSFLRQDFGNSFLQAHDSNLIDSRGDLQHSSQYTSSRLLLHENRVHYCGSKFFPDHLTPGHFHTLDPSSSQSTGPHRADRGIAAFEVAFPNHYSHYIDQFHSIPTKIPKTHEKSP